MGDVYVGAALGTVWYPELEGDARDFENELRQVGYTDINNLSLSSDDQAFAWSAFAGYTLNDNFAIEVGYLGSGEVSQRLDLTGMLDGDEVSVDVKAKVRRWSLYGALVGQVSVDSSFVVPFVKIGARRWDDESEGNGNDNACEQPGIGAAEW